MLYIVWNNSYEFGIPIIDEQHRSLITTINTLHHFIQEKLEEDALKPVLNIITQYTILHFKTEEKLLIKWKYPDYNRHHLLHLEMIRKTKEITNEAITYDDSKLVIKFLKDWWLNHIQKEDRKYNTFIKDLKTKRNNS